MKNSMKKFGQIMSSSFPTSEKGVKFLLGEFVHHEFAYLYSGVLLYAESGLQNISIIENDFWGRMLFINSSLQFTERDEFIYHEALVHIPIQSAPRGKIKKVLICGGGDFGASREVLKYPEIEEVIIVDIDPKVPQLVKRFFPFLLPENPEDKRLKLITADAYEMVKKFLKEEKKFDLVIMDTTDPDVAEKEEGKTQELSHALFSEEFHSLLKELAPEGIIVQQCGTPFTMKEILENTYKIFKKVYPKEEIYCYRADVPSFGGDNAYLMRCPFENPEIPKWEEPKNTYYYHHKVHPASFGLPKFWKEVMEDYF